MGDLLPLLRDFTPGTYGIWTLVLLGIAYFVREWRETRKLSAEDRLARREGYAKQVEMLMRENRALMDDQRKLREEYDQYRQLCHAENNELRGMVIRLEGEVEGYKRRVDSQSMELARLKGIDPDERLGISR